MQQKVVEDAPAAERFDTFSEKNSEDQLYL